MHVLTYQEHCFMTYHLPRSEGDPKTHGFADFHTIDSVDLCLSDSTFHKDWQWALYKIKVRLGNAGLNQITIICCGFYRVFIISINILSYMMEILSKVFPKLTSSRNPSYWVWSIAGSQPPTGNSSGRAITDSGQIYKTCAVFCSQQWCSLFYNKDTFWKGKLGAPWVYPKASLTHHHPSALSSRKAQLKYQVHN